MSDKTSRVVVGVNIWSIIIHFYTWYRLNYNKNNGHTLIKLFFLSGKLEKEFKCTSAAA